VLFGLISLLMRAAVRVYFKGVRVRHAERFPARGPVLLVANHPAMWTDVLVLDVALRRKLQFLTQGALFHPRLRAMLLHLHGALPVLAATDGPGARARNADTFRRCREMFASGSVIAMFPEGVSQEDRTVLQLKTGAARIAVEQAALGPPRAVPALIPAGIHYANRTAFGSEVTVSVGEPIDLAPYVALARGDADAAVHALTEHMHRALRELILDLPEPTLAAAVAELEPLAAISNRAGTCELGSAQRIAARLESLRAATPERFLELQRHTRRYRRVRRALSLSDRALLWDPWTAPWRRRLGLLAVVCTLGALPGTAGAALHAVPWGAGELIAHRVGRDPVRFSFARIASGIVLFPVGYALVLLALLQSRILGAAEVLGALVLFVVLGLWTLAWTGWLRALAEHVRLLWLQHGHGRLVRRARAEQRALLALLRTIRDEPAAAPETAS
jgi:1-acyl-sn-glycerol-3-phosphate acyltransferase